MWQWLSTPPGVTMRPSASISRRPAPSFAPIVAMRPSMTPMSARNTSDAVASVPLRTTRSYSAMMFAPRFPAIPGPRAADRSCRRRRAGDRRPFSQPRLEAGQQPVELGDVGGVELRPGRAHRGRANGAAPAQHLLAHRKPKSWLLLVAHQRQISVEQVLRLVAASGREQRAHGDQHLRIGKAGHDAVCAARQFLRHVQPAIADQDADVASRAAIAGFAYLRELLQARAVLVLEHHHGGMRGRQS